MSYQGDYRMEVMLAVGTWTAVFIVLALPLSYLFCKLDRKNKDGPRCRTCGFDLRASTGDSCNECGTSLSPRGVWPPNKPSRRPLAIAIALWSWLCVSLTIVAIVAYNRHTLDIAANCTITNSLFLIDTIHPGTEISVYASGNDLTLFPNPATASVQAEQITLLVFINDILRIGCTYNLKTQKYETPIDPMIREAFLREFGSIEPNVKNNLPPKDFLSQSIHYYYDNLSPEDEPATKNNISAVIDLANKYANDRKLTANGGGLSDQEYNQFKDDPLIEKQFPWHLNLTNSYLNNTNITHPPGWFAYAIPITGLLIWGVGLLVLRRRIYARQACGTVDAEVQTV